MSGNYSSLVIAYFTGSYARASDTFIRAEVRLLRQMGHTVHTFSVRRPPQQELITDEIRAEYENTEYMLDGRWDIIAGSFLKALFLSPRRFFLALRIAVKTGNPGIKGRLWPIAHLVEAARLSERLKRNKIQHIHCHIAAGAATVTMLAAKIANIPFSFTVHGPGEFIEAAHLTLDEKIHHAAFVATISEYARAQLFRWCRKEDREKIHIVRCGVGDIFLSAVLTPPPEEKRFVNIGRLCEAKGQMLLIEAVRLLAKEGFIFKLILIGDGPLHDEIEGFIKKNKLENYVELSGWMDSRNIQKELLASQALILPSFAEGLPVVLMESLALGRPAVSTAIAGIPELVEPGVSGWLVPAGSLEKLLEALRDLLNSPKERLEAMGHAGAKKVAEQHDEKKEIVKLEGLIRRSCQNSSSLA